MSRPRRYTEHLGLLVSVQEDRIVKQHVRSRKMTVADYLRQVAVQPLVDALQAEKTDGPQD